MPLRGHVMFTPFDASSGAALTSATVNVFQPGTVTPVAGTLFDKSGGTLANPLTSDVTTGLVDFYMNVAQEVDLQVAKSGFTTRTYSNVPVLDDAGNDLTALMTGVGDIVYSSAASTPARLAIGATGSFLTNTGASTPGWSNTISAGGLTISAGGLTVTAGNAGIGVAPRTDTAVAVQGALTTTGTAQDGIWSNFTASSLATAAAYAFDATPATAAAAFTCAVVAGFHANTPTKGAGSAITTAYGVLVEQITTGTTNIGALINTGLVVDGAVPTTSGTQIGFGGVTAAAGGGATATLTTIGGTGPTAAAQQAWLKIAIGGNAKFIPYWA